MPTFYAYLPHTILKTIHECMSVQLQLAKIVTCKVANIYMTLNCYSANLQMTCLLSVEDTAILHSLMFFF